MNEAAHGAQVRRILHQACLADLEAFKPGNVGLHGDGHGMTVADFRRSAEVAVPALCAPGLTPGARILGAIEATAAAVGCNTNLGIVLLAAPLVHAALQSLDPDLPGAVRTVLARLTRADAELAYAAIRLARPGGMGTVAAHDLAQAPRVTLLEAMRAAADRDRIALQYATGFADVFGCMRRWLARGEARFGPGPWAVTACFLAIAARWPDTLVLRRHGAKVAEAARARLADVEKALQACENPESAIPLLRQVDEELKRGGVNPGTSADLTVATLLAQRLETCLRRHADGRRAAAAGA